MHSLTHSLTRALKLTLTHSRSHSHTLSLTHSFTRSLSNTHSALLNTHSTTQGQRPEALKEEPYSVTDSLFQLLLEISTRAASNGGGVGGINGAGSKIDANSGVHHGHHAPRLVASCSSTSIPHHPTRYARV